MNYEINGDILCFPPKISQDILSAVRAAGYSAQLVSAPIEVDAKETGFQGYLGGVVDASDNLDQAISFCQSLRRRDPPFKPIILIIAYDQLIQIDRFDSLFDEICLSPIVPLEFELRVKLMIKRMMKSKKPGTIEHGPLSIDLDTYQAAIAGKALDLTYMEYELLRFLASHPGKVFTRETLLARVWGYEYYGGARTVDVHVRRLRAKLGEEYANLIQTVRSVGYRFGDGKYASQNK